jgi:hypothetical protein
MKIDSMGFTLQDVVLLIGMQARTGELVMESDNNIGTILFYNGNVLQTSSPYSRAIGDLLVEEGLISDTDLIEALLHQKKAPGSPLGSLLIQTGKVTFDIIEMKVHEQMRQAVKEFQSWKGIAFSFVSKGIQPYDRIHLTAHEFISPETLSSAVNFLSGYALQPQDRPLPTDPSSRG